MNKHKIQFAIAYAQTILNHALNSNSVPCRKDTSKIFVSDEMECFYEAFSEAIDTLSNLPFPEDSETNTL